MIRIVLLFVFGLAAAAADAQTLYRWTDPATGRTVLSDLPPPPDVKATTREGTGADVSDAALPYATRTAAEKYPVTLFTGPDCGGFCDQARTFLKGRGIPFREKSVSNAEELEALKKLAGDTIVPVLTVGKEVQRGFASGPWDALLDLAGYPKTAPAGR